MTPQLGAASPRPPNHHKKRAAMPRLAMARHTQESDMSIQSAGFVVLCSTRHQRASRHSPPIAP